MGDTDFYRAFEDRYRGSRELIKSRLTVYLQFILPLKQFDGACQGIDLGCGRGEWLELMQENGVAVQGVDLDQGMLEAALARGLNVRHGDVIQSLQSLAAESQILVTGFHIAEHLPFDSLQALIRESLRVLKPGGLLILETPNPENIVVGTVNFYLDPTHQRPIPAQLLSFMAEYAGFGKVKTLRLQEPAGLADSNALALLSVLNGVSPDYAIVAQKTGAPEIIAVLNPTFDADYGLSLESLANRYDQQAEAKAQQAEVVAQQAEAKAQQAEAKAQQAEAKAQQAETKAQQAEAKAQQAETKAQQAETKAQQAETKAQQAETKAQQAETKAQQAEVVAQQAETALIAIYNSSSWRLTAPLRKFGNIVKNLSRLPSTAKSKTKQKIKLILAHAKLYINQRPKLKRLVFALLAPFPSLKNRPMQATMAASTPLSARSYGAIELSDLTPRARLIYDDLKAAIENHSKERS